jgi:hypothetical protein
MLGEPGGCLAAQLLPLMHATVVVAYTLLLLCCTAEHCTVLLHLLC